MKKTFTLIFSAAFFLISLAGHGQDFSKPTDYMSYIQKQQSDITQRYLRYVSASAHGKREKKVEALRSKLMDEIQNARMNISGMASWNGDKAYRDTAVSFMKFYYNVMNDDYAKVINMEELAEKSYDEMEAYINLQEAIQQKLDENNTRMSKAEKDFAGRNNINLIDSKSEMSLMMEEVGGTNDHYNLVFLIYFKPSVQDQNLSESLSKANVTAVEQNRSAMQKYALEGLDKIKAVKGYKGDNSLVRACTNSLNFFLKEADKMSTVSDYFLAKEKFEAVKKEMDGKRKKTQEDVDAYNKAVNDINKASQNYNSVITDMNERRRTMIAEWNSAVKTFYDDHTPRYK